VRFDHCVTLGKGISMCLFPHLLKSTYVGLCEDAGQGCKTGLMHHRYLVHTEATTDIYVCILSDRHVYMCVYRYGTKVYV
jgi:hypothetical protein